MEFHIAFHSKDEQEVFHLKGQTRLESLPSKVFKIQPEEFENLLLRIVHFSLVPISQS